MSEAADWKRLRRRVSAAMRTAGFRLVRSKMDRRAFGSWVLDFRRSSRLISFGRDVRFVNDRGQVFVEVENSCPGPWREAFEQLTPLAPPSSFADELESTIDHRKSA